MPFYVADYLADTMHFTCPQHGAYLMLLFAGWIAGGDLPDSDEQIAAITKQTPRDWLRMRPIIAAKFTIADGVWRQNRLSRELMKATGMYQASVENGKRGGRPRKTETQNKPGDNPDPNPDHNLELTQTLTQRKHNSQLTKNKVKDLCPAEPDGFVRFWKSYPNTPRRTAKAKCAVLWARRGLEVRAEEIVRHVEAMKRTRSWQANDQGDSFEPSTLTYLNQSRWEDGMPAGAETAQPRRLAL